MTKVHYDIVGSFLRPQELKQARTDFAAGKISHDQLTQIENKCIKELVAKEAQHGLKIVTDGEFRRSYWHLDTFWGFAGIDHVKSEHGYFFHGEETRNDSARLSGRISFSGDHPDLRSFKYLKSLTEGTNLTPRQSIPAPSQLFLELYRGSANQDAVKKYYSDTAALIADIAQAYHDLILALYEAGARDVKLDDCTWGLLADDDVWAHAGDSSDFAFSRDEYKDLFLQLNNAAIKDLPSDLRLSTHVCRGNYHSTYADSGSYDSVAKWLLAQENVDAFYLEYDDARSGNFEPLQEVPADKDVVLGLITSKRPQLEGKEEVKHRIKEASEYVDLPHLSLSTQCGFASTEEGNILTEAEEWAKIQLVETIANEVWTPAIENKD
ncbi:5-methyltetrahydropteroyltriglutamate--homocysteine S-methyltransferase [Lactobacillus corticis]|uniref:5-methyltetrahydropteroyltriglutamate--homocysteine methyltransferase n=1 Tax=Lactobacillus corticis TaxID=2201249 RepID=A0A916QKY3_9LACO|nr:5-methyltetrahydropteroyltriglutamate--homocysteine S-methyltransferase [Lactobacillus corticis]GFZ27351.1 5-methyltetrahydropteroyltriglutamate--homocysteine methyltransferase [Lactobacillus corticis]